MNYLTKGEHVYGEGRGPSKDPCGKAVVTDGDKLFYVETVPTHNCTGEAQVFRLAVEKNGVGD